MRARQLMIAIAAFSLPAAVGAEPGKAPVVKAEQPASESAPVTVAAADVSRTPAVQARGDSAEAPKRRARVTTCRCGGDSATK